MLGYQPLPRTVDAALRDAESPRLTVRVSVLADLARHARAGHAGAARMLQQLLGSDPAAMVRAQAAVALADAGCTDARDALLQALSDPQPSVQQMVLLAMGELGEASDARVVSAIEAATQEDVPSLRFQALIAAQRLGLPREILVTAMDDTDPLVRHIAIRLVEQRNSPSDEGVPPVLTPDLKSRLTAALRDPEPRVRLVAAVFLARGGDEAAHAVLAEAIAAIGRADPEDEQAAIVLAGELGLKNAIPALERQAFPWFGPGRFGYEAQVALARMGHARARARIMRGLSSFDRDRRTLHVVAAGRSVLVEARPLLLAMAGDPRRAEPEAVASALAALDRATR